MGGATLLLRDAARCSALAPAVASSVGDAPNQPKALRDLGDGAIAVLFKKRSSAIASHNNRLTVGRVRRFVVCASTRGEGSPPRAHTRRKFAAACAHAAKIRRMAKNRRMPRRKIAASHEHSTISSELFRRRCSFAHNVSSAIAFAVAVAFLPGYKSADYQSVIR